MIIFDDNMINSNFVGWVVLKDKVRAPIKKKKDKTGKELRGINCNVIAPVLSANLILFSYINLVLTVETGKLMELWKLNLSSKRMLT